MASLFHVLCTSLLKILPDFVISRCWGGCKYFEIQSFGIQKQDMSWSRYHLKWNTYKHKRLIAYSRPDCIRRHEISLGRPYCWIFQTNILKMGKKTDLTSPSIVIPKHLQGFWNFVQIVSRKPVNTACSHRSRSSSLCGFEFDATRTKQAEGPIISLSQNEAARGEKFKIWRRAWVDLVFVL